MEIQQLARPADLQEISEDILGFDLEMANSFRHLPPVICMIGTDRYDADRALCVVTIASITRREEEADLIAWFLDHLSEFKARHPRPKLATFAGSDNDIPWVMERIRRHKLAPQKAKVIQQFDNLDLRVEYQKRTQTNQISLKGLEQLVGIERNSGLSSRKVSYILTDVLSRNDRRASIPEKIYEYLKEDVHNLLLIWERWKDIAFHEHLLSEFEYLNKVVQLVKYARKLVNDPPSRFNSRQLAGIRDFADRLDEELGRAIARESFAEFRLCPVPPLEPKHPATQRLRKKHEHLASIELIDGKDQSYRLGRQLQKPKGSLALVRRDGRLLMIKRAESVERAPGYWGLPGGVLEQGESPTRGAVRELDEELNLKGIPVQLLGTQPSMSKAYELFWVEVLVEDPSTLRPRAEEVAEARWVTPQELLALQPLIPGAVEGFRQFLGPRWAPQQKRAGPSVTAR